MSRGILASRLTSRRVRATNFARPVPKTTAEPFTPSTVVLHFPTKKDLQELEAVQLQFKYWRFAVPAWTDWEKDQIPAIIATRQMKTR